MEKRRVNTGIPAGAALLALVAALLAAPPTARAAEVSGVLRGASGNERHAIGDAELTFCRKDAPDRCFSTITNGQGWFRFADIPDGSYRVTTRSSSGGTSAGTVDVPPEGAHSLSIIAR